jgi:adenine-specific DNA-methyltransferase
MSESDAQFHTFSKDTDIIYHGNAIEVLESGVIPDYSAHLIFADPPYNIGKRFHSFVDKWPSEEAYLEWTYHWLDLCIRKLTPNGSMYVMASTQMMPHVDMYLRTRLHILSRIVWHYDSSGVQARKYFGSMYEPILFCVKDKSNYVFNASDVLVEAKTGAQRKLIDYRGPVPKRFNTHKVPGNVWSFPRVRYRMAEYEQHPSQKPEALLERIVRASSEPHDIVLDPFSGTFTTSAVAKRFGRRTIGIELQEEYVKTGLRRMGIQAEYNGEPLEPLQKLYVRRNGAHGRDVPAGQRAFGET